MTRFLGGKAVTDAAWRERNRPQLREKAKLRYHSDPEYRASVLADRLFSSTGWTVSDKHIAFDLQEGRCAICLNDLPSVDASHADHDHKTMKPRELLCRMCNQMIGCALDDPEILRSAIRYLELHRA